jgi:hypothetical protein
MSVLTSSRVTGKNLSLTAASVTVDNTSAVHVDAGGFAQAAGLGAGSNSTQSASGGSYGGAYPCLRIC